MVVVMVHVEVVVAVAVAEVGGGQGRRCAAHSPHSSAATVDLPQPDGPSSATRSPGAIESDAWRSTGASGLAG
jgi:hypothetical protein